MIAQKADYFNNYFPNTRSKLLTTLAIRDILNTVQSPCRRQTKIQTTTKTAINLFQAGYRCRAGVEPNTILVRNADGVIYTVNPLTCSCSCPWGQKRSASQKCCKHISTLAELVYSQWQAVRLDLSPAAN